MRRTDRHGLGWAVVALVCGLGCTVHERTLEYDDGTGGGGGATSVSIGDAVAQQSAAICGKIRDCAPGILGYLYGSYDECVARANLGSMFATGLPDVQLDVATVQACADAYAQVPCESYFWADPDACWVPGRRANGEGCNTGDQCASMFCKQDAWSCGTCAPMPGVGTACTSGRDCGRATWCTSAGTCQKPRNLNEACSASLPCNNNLVCNQAKCVVPPASSGAACNAPSGLYCDFTKNFTCASTSQCVPITWVGSGQACGTTTARASFCMKHDPCTSSSCSPTRSDKRACDPANDPCEWPGLCSSAKTCMMPSDAPVCAR